VAGVTLTVIGGVILGAFFFAGEGPFKPKPKDLIVGKWELFNRVEKKNRQIIFYKDGQVEFVGDRGGRMQYRFVDEKYVEITSPRDTESLRIEVKFQTSDEMTITFQGDAPVSCKRVK